MSETITQQAAAHHHRPDPAILAGSPRRPPGAAEMSALHHLQVHPKPWCVECGSRELAWTNASPYGTVYSYTVSRSVAMNFPGWGGELPVLMCLVDLDDGARMYAQVTDCTPEELHIGMRVQAYFEPISDEAGIPKFRPRPHRRSDR